MIMKHTLILLTLMLTAMAASAQANLNINALFGERYRKSEKVVETIVSGEALKGSHLELYRSLVLTDMPESADEIAAAVAKDGTKAMSREVKYLDGQLYYAQFMLQPKGKTNRYIFYVNRHLKGGNKIMLVYMAGSASPEDIKKLLKNE